jgi:FAD-dependent urate hydroxylase
MTSSGPVLVVGGGIAGAATAIALRKAGIDCVIYEAHDVGADGIGAFLTVASNGVDALRVLDADQQALAAAFPTPGITLRSGTGKLLGEARTGGVLSDGTVSQTIKRSDVYRALIEVASSRGVPVEHGKRLVGAQDTEAGVRAVFADGSEAVGSLLIGCDGVHSTVRGLIDPAAPPPRYSGLLNTGGYARGAKVNTEPGSYEMIFGRKGFFGYALAPDGEVWWFANLPRRREPARGESPQASGQSLRGELLALFALDAGPAIDLINATEEIMPVTPIHTLQHLPAWHRGRMVVLGDAAHAPSPTSGQGASLSIEDAVVLARCLRDRPDPQSAFAAFEAARRPRVERIIKWAARINNSKAAGPVGRVIRDAMMPAVMRMTADSKAHREAYDYHLDWNGPAPTRATA